MVVQFLQPSQQVMQPTTFLTTHVASNSKPHMCIQMELVIQFNLHLSSNFIHSTLF